MTTPRARRIRRVLVAVDASPGSQAAAAAAARLAAALEAELAGLFVEDRELLRLIESPQAHQVGFLTAAAERLGGEEMERQLRAQAERARRTLARLAEREGVRVSFRVVRGRVESEVLAASGREDLVSVGRSGWSTRPGRRLGSTARALLEGRLAHVLLIERGATVAPPIAVLVDGSRAAGDALRLAARLARRERLVVLVTGDEARRQAEGELGEGAAQARFEALAGAPTAAVVAAVDALRPGLLVLPVGGPGLDGGELQDLLAELRCPVLAVS